jgi:hypothetical protein
MQVLKGAKSFLLHNIYQTVCENPKYERMRKRYCTSASLGCACPFSSTFFYQSTAREAPAVVDNIIKKGKIKQQTKRFKYKWANPSLRTKAGPRQKNYIQELSIQLRNTIEKELFVWLNSMWLKGSFLDESMLPTLE